MPTRNKPQKINKRVTTSKYKTNGKINAYLLNHNRPAGEKMQQNKQHFGTRLQRFMGLELKRKNQNEK